MTSLDRTITTLILVQTSVASVLAAGMALYMVFVA